MAPLSASGYMHAMTSTGPEDRPHRVRDVIERLDRLTDRDRLSLGDIVAAFGRTSFLPLLLVPALLVISPLSGIPGLSSLCGLTIALIAAQMAARRAQVWLPGMLGRKTVAGARVHRGMDRLRGAADWLDRHTGDRLAWMTYQPFALIAQLGCLLSGLAMPFLELVPFSSSILGTATVLFVVGLLVHDGLFVLGGLALMLVASSIPVVVMGALLGP